MYIVKIKVDYGLGMEDLAKGDNRVFYFEEGARETPRLTAKTWQTKDQRMLEAFY